MKPLLPSLLLAFVGLALLFGCSQPGPSAKTAGVSGTVDSQGRGAARQVMKTAVPAAPAANAAIPVSPEIVPGLFTTVTTNDTTRAVNVDTNALGQWVTESAQAVIAGGISNPAILYVEVNGRDTNAGTFGAPLLTVGEAVSLAVSNTIIKLGAGTFPITNIAPAAGVGIEGAGRNVTFITSTNVGHAAFTYWIRLTNGTSLRDLTLRNGENGGRFIQIYPVQSTADNTNILLENVEINGDSDGVAITPGTQGKMVNCALNGTWDLVVNAGPPVTTNVWELYNCELKSTYNPKVPLEYAGGGGPGFGIHASGSIFKMYGGSIRLSGFTNHFTTVNWENDVEGVLNLASGVAMENDAGEGNGYLLAGPVTVQGHGYPENLTDHLQLYLGDATNAPMPKAFLQAAPNGGRYWSVDGSGLVNVTATGLVVPSNNFPVTAGFANLGNGGAVLWNSNGVHGYWISTNVLNHSASTNLAW